MVVGELIVRGLILRSRIGRHMILGDVLVREVIRGEGRVRKGRCRDAAAHDIDSERLQGMTSFIQGVEGQRVRRDPDGPQRLPQILAVLWIFRVDERSGLDAESQQ